MFTVANFYSTFTSSLSSLSGVLKSTNLLESRQELSLRRFQTFVIQRLESQIKKKEGPPILFLLMQLLL